MLFSCVVVSPLDSASVLPKLRVVWKYSAHGPLCRPEKRPGGKKFVFANLN